MLDIQKGVSGNIYIVATDTRELLSIIWADGTIEYFDD